MYQHCVLFSKLFSCKGGIWAPAITVTSNRNYLYVYVVPRPLIRLTVFSSYTAWQNVPISQSDACHLEQITICHTQMLGFWHHCAFTTHYSYRRRLKRSLSPSIHLCTSWGGLMKKILYSATGYRDCNTFRLIFSWLVSGALTVCNSWHDWSFNFISLLIRWLPEKIYPSILPTTHAPTHPSIHPSNSSTKSWIIRLLVNPIFHRRREISLFGSMLSHFNPVHIPDHWPIILQSILMVPFLDVLFPRVLSYQNVVVSLVSSPG
jgi:hypothetical protein